MTRRGKKYIEAVAKIEDRLYSPEEAIKLVKEISFAGFDETVELHARLGIDPRNSDQLVRTTVVLPHGLGKEVKVLVFAEGEAANAAEAAGADIIADDEIIKKIEGGWVDFDTAIATPDMMRTIGKLGRVLGRRGLMPNPKSGTVVQPDQMARAIEEARAGKVDYRNDKTGNVHAPIGKVSFTEEQLLGNMSTFMESLRLARPAASKGAFVRRLVVKTTMSPGIKVEPMVALTMGA